MGVAALVHRLDIVFRRPEELSREASQGGGGTVRGLRVGKLGGGMAGAGEGVPAGEGADEVGTVRGLRVGGAAGEAMGVGEVGGAPCAGPCATLCPPCWLSPCP